MHNWEYPAPVSAFLPTISISASVTFISLSWLTVYNAV
jgi:hypothetical protein